MNIITNAIAHWKTTLAGITAAVAHVSVNGTNWHSLLSAAALAAIGVLAQDAKSL